MSVVRVSACGGALNPARPASSAQIPPALLEDPGRTGLDSDEARGDEVRGTARDDAPITDVLFDFCGVLVDWQPARPLEGRFPTRLVEDFVSYGDRCGFMYYDDMVDGGASLSDVFASYEAERGPELARALRTYYGHIDEALVGLMPGMLDFVGELKAAGLGVWGLTNWGRETYRAFEERFPLLLAQLDGVFVSGREGVRKPDARCYEQTLERFGLSASRTLFFDDNPLNVDAARAVGLRSERFRNAGRCRADLARYGVDLDARRAGACVLDARGGLVSEDCGAACSADQLHFQLTATPGRSSREGWRAVRLGDLVFSPSSDPRAGRFDAEFWPSRHREYNELGWHEMDWDAVRRELTRVAESLAGCEEGGTHPGLVGVEGAVGTAAAEAPHAGDRQAVPCAEGAGVGCAGRLHVLGDGAASSPGSGRSSVCHLPVSAPLIELSAPSMRERMFLEMWFGYGDPAVMASERSDGRFDVTYGGHRVCALADFPMGLADQQIMLLGPSGFTPDGPLDPDTLLPVLVRGRSADAGDTDLDDDPNDGLRPAA